MLDARRTMWNYGNTVHTGGITCSNEHEDTRAKTKANLFGRALNWNYFNGKKRDGHEEKKVQVANSSEKASIQIFLTSLLVIRLISNSVAESETQLMKEWYPIINTNMKATTRTLEINNKKGLIAIQEILNYRYIDR